MKKLLLSLSFVAFSFSMNAQGLQNENFNTLTIGNVGTDITGTTPGQNSWLTFSTNNGPAGTTTTSTNAGNTNFQIVANGNLTTNGLRIESGNGNYGSRFMWKDGLGASWATRTAGNNIIEVEYDFYTGPVTDSRTQVGMRIFGDDNSTTPPTSRSLNGFVYTTNTRVLQGVAYLNNGGTYGTFVINLATGGLVLNSDTWYTIGCSYNTATGEVLWKTSPTATASGITNAVWVPGLVPNEVDFLNIVVGPNPAANPPVPANTLASNIIFDNYVSRASASNTLLSVDEVASIELEVISVYPNPSKDVINVNSSINSFNSISIVDLNGRVVKNVNFDAVTEAQINISDLASGVYVMNVTSEKETFSKKIVKE